MNKKIVFSLAFAGMMFAATPAFSNEGDKPEAEQKAFILKRAVKAITDPVMNNKKTSFAIGTLAVVAYLGYKNCSWIKEQLGITEEDETVALIEAEGNEQ